MIGIIANVNFSILLLNMEYARATAMMNVVGGNRNDMSMARGRLPPLFVKLSEMMDVDDIHAAVMEIHRHALVGETFSAKSSGNKAEKSDTPISVL